MTVFRYYRIKSLIDNKSYIGKTTQTLKQRLQNHHRDLTAYLKKTRNSSNRGSFKIIKEKANKKVTCPICGGKYTHQNKSNHCNTIKHQEAIYKQDQAK